MIANINDVQFELECRPVINDEIMILTFAPSAELVVELFALPYDVKVELVHGPGHTETFDCTVPCVTEFPERISLELHR